MNVVPGTRFCGECGHRFSDGTAAETPVVRAPERRLVSVLFADLVGYSTMSEHRDPEDVRDFLSSYFAVARDVIERYGGTVEKFIGDAVMGTWGTPVTREDDAELAVRAALDLPIEVAELGRRSDVDVAVRVGVATGEVAVLLHTPAGEGMAGDLVNTASRLEGLAEPGTVLVNAGTHRAAARAIAFTDMGELTVKGKSETVRAFRPLRVAAKVGAAAASTLAEPVFVGRERELHLLRDTARRTAVEKRANLVSVIGVAGIGKSRLADELEKHLDGLTATTYWHRGRSPSYGDGVTFWALSEMVKNRADIVDADGDDVQRRKLAATVERYVEEADRQWVATGLGVLLGLEPAGVMASGEAEAAWRRFFEAIAADAPAVLVFEDLHWADSGLLDFVESMLGWSHRSPLTIVTLARPELLERRPTWGAGLAGFTSVRLEPLDEIDVDHMLESMAPGLPAEVKQAVSARAEGVPLYIVEMVRMLIDEGIVTVTEAGAEVTGQVRFSMPESLHALVAARLDALGTEDRRLVQHAAVLGQSFDHKSLAEISGVAPGDVGSRLERLVIRQILRVDDDPRSNERGFYQFVQSVIREVALGTISKSERRDLHLRIADHLDTTGDSEVLPVIVHHLTEAMRLGSAAEASELRSRALALLSRAAERSGTLGSHEQELGFLEQAVALADGPAQSAPLLSRLAVAAEIAGHSERALAARREALAGHRDAGDAEAVARAAGDLARSLMAEAVVTEAASLLDSAIDEAIGREVAADAVAELLSQRARAAAFNADGELAVELSDRAARMAESVLATEVVIDAMITRAWALIILGRELEGTATLIGALDLAEEHGSRAEYRARNNLMATRGWSDPARAVGWVEPGLHRALRSGDLENFANLSSGLAAMLIEIGDLARVDEVLESVPSLAFSEQTQQSLATSRIWVHALRGETDRVAELTPILERAAMSDDSVYHRGVALSNLTLADIPAGRFDDALRRLSMVEESARDNEVLCLIGVAALRCRDRSALRDALVALDATRSDPRTDRWARALRAASAVLDGDDTAGAVMVECAREAKAQRLLLDAADMFTEAAVLLTAGHPDQVESERQARDLWSAIGASAMSDLLERRLRSRSAASV